MQNVPLMSESLATGLTTDEVAAAAVGDPPPLADHVPHDEAVIPETRGIRRLFNEPMWVLGLVILMDEIDKNIVRGMIIPIQDEFGVGDGAIGVLLACSLLVSGLVTVPAGYLADRWVRTRAIGWTVVGWSGLTALGAAAMSFPMLVGIRSALGFGQAITEPSAASLLGDYYPPEERGKAFSIQQVMVIAGGGIGIALGGGLAAIFNWRIGMLVAAIPALGVAWLAYRMREPKRGTADLMAAIGGGQVEHAEEGDHEPLFEQGFRQFVKDMVDGLREDMRTVLSIRTMRYACVGVAALLFTVTAILAWLGPYYQRQLNFPEGQGEAIVGMLVLFGGVPGVLLGGRVADRWAPKMEGGRLALPAIFLFIGTTFFTLAYLFRMPPGVDTVDWSVAGPAIALQLAGVFVMTMSLPGLRAGLTDAIPAHLRGAGFGAFNLAAVVGGQAAAPLIVGVISGAFDDNLRIAFLAVTPLSFIGAGVLFHARKFLDEDMNKIMMAVLQALQDEKERAEEKAAEQGIHPG